MEENPPGLNAPTHQVDIQQQILETVLKEQAYQDLGERLRLVEEQLSNEKKEKDKALQEKSDLTFANEQLQEASKTNQTSYTAANAEIRNYRARLELVNNEKKEMQKEVDGLKQKHKSDDGESDYIRILREQAESNSRTIRQLDSERIQAISDKDGFQHNHNILKAALETSRSEVKMYSDALIKKDAEFASYRTSHYAELQRVTLLVDSLSVEVSNLQSSRTEVQRQYEAKVVALESSERGKQDLQIKLDQQTASFRDESSKLHAAVQSLEIRSSDDRENVEQFEQAFRQAEEKHRRLLDEAEGVADEAIRAKEAAIQRMKEMEQAVETLSAAYPDGGSSAISATANVLAQAQETGQTIGQIYINSARNAMALNKANEEISRLEAVLKEVVLEISSKAPELKQQRKDYEQVKAEAQSLVVRLNQTLQAKDIAETALDRLQGQHASFKDEIQMFRSQVADLTLQVRTLTREIAVRDDPSLAYEAFDPLDAEDNADISDIDAVITGNLTAFRKLPELLEQNKKLLRISREMGRKLESKMHATSTRPSIDSSLEENVMSEAHDIIFALRDELDSVKQDLQEVKSQSSVLARERDLFSRMLVQSRISGEFQNAVGNGSTSIQAGEVAVESVLQSLQQQFDHHRQTYQAQTKALETRLKEQANLLAAESERLTESLRALSHEQSQNSSLRDRRASDAILIQSHDNACRQKDAAINQLRLEIQRISEDRDKSTAEVSRITSQLNAAQAERAVWEQTRQNQSEQVKRMIEENATLRTELGNRESLRSQELDNLKTKRNDLERTNEKLERDLTTLRAELAKERDSHKATQALVQQDRQKELQEAFNTAQLRINELERVGREAAEAHGKAISELEKQRTIIEDRLQIAEQGLETSRIEAVKSKEIGLKYQRSKRAVDEALVAVQAELKTKETELAAARSELDTATTERSALRIRVNDLAKQSSQNPLPVPATPSDQGVTGSQEVAELKAQISRLEAQVSLPAAPDTALTAEVDRLRTELAKSHAEVERLGRVVTEGETQVTLARSEIEKIAAQSTARDVAAQQEAEGFRKKISELETGQATGQNVTINDSAIGQEDAAELVKTRQELQTLQKAFDIFRTEQAEKYNEDVKKVNGVNAKLSSALRARPTLEEVKKVQDQLVESALNKQRESLEAEHKAALDAQSAAIKAEIVEEAKPDQSTPLAQLREELEQTKQKLSNADTKLLRMAVVESNNTRRQAELEKLKAQIKALEENNGGQGSAGQMSIRGAGTAQPAASLASAGSAMIRPAASGSVSSPAVPGRGRLVARGGVRGGARGGAARGGANQAGQRSNLGPAAILAAAGFGPSNPAVTTDTTAMQGAKRRASQTESDKEENESKRVKTGDAGDEAQSSAS